MTSRRLRIRSLAAAGVVFLGLTAATGCSRGTARSGHHAGEEHAAEPAPPTPDTTPIAILRTPAGLVLSVEETPLPPSAEATTTAGPVTPVASPAAPAASPASPAASPAAPVASPATPPPAPAGTPVP